MKGQVTAAVVTPSQDGWKWRQDTKEIFLGVDINDEKLQSLNINKSSVALALPDGKIVKPQKHVPGFTKHFQHRLWFTIPGDTKQATVQVSLQVKPSGGSLKDLGVVKVPITLTREN